MCCKCCQYCLESCYWHLIEKRFCYDESIALYQEPEKEKNNNVFDNMAFYDSVAVIAGRSIVTIDPLPQNTPVVVQQPVAQRYVSQELAAPQTEQQEEPIVGQPTRKLQFSELKTGYFSKSVPLIFERTITEEDVSKSDTTISNNKEASECEGKSTSCDSIESISTETKSLDEDKENSAASKNKNLLNPDSNVEFRRKSLLERRMSKSLYLKIDHHKEIPIIRQNSMPKFYLDTPQFNQTESSIYRTPSTALASPVKPKSEFVFDLYSVVQLEKNRMNSSKETSRPLPQKDDRSSKLFHLKDKIKLRRVKSSLATITSIPHTHHI